MRQIAAIRELMHHGEARSPVFTKSDLVKIFREDNPQTLNASLNRLVESGVLVRAVKGVYVNALFQRQDAHMIEHIARAMRRGHHSYVSLESALSQHGVISQLPLLLTVMSTGRKGKYTTPYGTIEFTHTQRPVLDVIDGSVDVGRPLRLARKWTAFRDLKRVGRNLDLVDMEVLHEGD